MSNKGFSLIELLITLGILAVVMIIAVPNVIDSLNNSKDRAYDILKENMITGAELYVTECKYSSSSLCSSISFDDDYFDIYAKDLVSMGFLNVPSGIVVDSDEMKIYNPKNNEDVSECLFVRVMYDLDNYKYTYVVNDEYCE